MASLKQQLDNETEEILCLMLLSKKRRKSRWNVRPLHATRRGDGEYVALVKQMRVMHEDSNMDDEEEQSVAPNQLESSSSENCLSSSSSSSAVPSPLPLQEYTTPVPCDLSTASKCTTSPCTETPSPDLNKRKRQTEDVLLKRLQRWDQEREMGKQQDNYDHRFGAVLIDMLSQVDPKEKPRVKLKLYQLLFEVLDKQQQNETASLI